MQHSLDLSDAKNPPLPFVEYDLPPKNKWNGLALVGEAPGADEVKLGHPFVGRSGQLLNEILAEAKVSRAECIIANVFRLQPPKNKVDHFFVSKRAAQQQQIDIAPHLGQFGSLWCRAEFAQEIETLRSTLLKWKPKAVIALGRTPLWALTGKNGILSLVGEKLESKLLNCEIPVIPTFHPSFIIRGNWSLRPNFVSHVKTAKNLAEAS